MKKKIFGLILCVAIAACIGVTGATGAFAYDTTISEWGIEHYNQLDVGLFWYTEIDQVIPVSDYKIDPSKPTIIYAHGWKPSDSHVREGLSLKSESVSALSSKGYDEYEYDPEFYNYYIKNGYNVGVFYWNQLSGDEGMSCDSKIWWSNGGKNMTYVTYNKVDAKHSDGVMSEPNDPTNPKESVALMYAHALIEALGKDYNKDLHLVGHSMGGQLTLAVSEALCYMKDKGQISKDFLPDRLTLCDPYLTYITEVTGTIDHSGKYVKDKNTAYLSGLAAETCANHAIPIESYGALESFVFRNYMSLASINGEDSVEYKLARETLMRLSDNIAWVHMKNLKTFAASSDPIKFAPTHVMSVDYYFSTNYMEPVKSKEGLQVPSAKMSNEDLKGMIGRCFVHYMENRSNPLYYNEGWFRLENPHTDTILQFEGNDQIGYIRGQLAITNRNKKPVTVQLADEDDKVIAEATVDEDGYYHFANVKTGTYSIKIYADTIHVDDIEDVEVDGTSIKTVIPETREVIVGGDKLLLYCVIGLAGVIILVCVIALIKGVFFTKMKKGGKRR